MLNLVKEYANKKLELVKLQALEKFSLGMGLILFLMFIAIIASFFIMLLNFGIALLVGSLIGNYAYGVLVMSLFYLIIFIVLYMKRKSILNFFSDKIIQFLNE